MWSKRVSSGTPEHPQTRDVSRALLIERGIETSWAHFEVVDESGWFGNLLSGKQPWIEVAFLNRESLELNPGIPKSMSASMPTIPEKWRDQAKRRWIVPVKDTDELTAWIDTCFAAVSGKPSYQLSGWIEGL
jgi:hypothetical protein